MKFRKLLFWLTIKNIYIVILTYVNFFMNSSFFYFYFFFFFNKQNKFLKVVKRA